MWMLIVNLTRNCINDCIAASLCCYSVNSIVEG